jgi:hypothetical protein
MIFYYIDNDYFFFFFVCVAAHVASLVCRCVSGAGTSIVRSYADLKARVNVDDLDLTQLEVRRVAMSHDSAGDGLCAVTNR